MNQKTIPAEPVTTIDYTAGKGVPVKYFLEPDLMPGEEAIAPLRELSRLPGVSDYIVALPDLHQKGRNLVPTGLVTVARNYIIPFAVDKGINCGIRIMALPLTAEDMNEEKIDAFYRQVMRMVPGDRHPHRFLHKDEVKSILLHGAEWMIRNYDVPESDLENIEKHGNMFRDWRFPREKILRAIPYDALKKGRRALGVLGGGNHFLELQKITRIVEPDIARQLGLKENQLILMMHAGTGGLGGSVMKFFHRVPRSNGRDERQEFFWEKVKFLSFWPWDVHRRRWFRAPHLYAIPSQSATARHFIMAINAVANFGFANRMMIAYWAEKAMQQVFRDDELKFRLLYDSSHVTIQAEEHFGKLYWVHRNGANQAMPASRMANHPVYRYTGQPIPIPGSMGTDSYIAVAAEGALQTFCSTNHGAGRLMDKPEARRSFREDQVVYSMEERGIRLYRYGKTPITDQAPEAFKNIDLVVEAMRKYRLATPVARVRPLATLKG